MEDFLGEPAKSVTQHVGVHCLETYLGERLGTLSLTPSWDSWRDSPGRSEQLEATWGEGTNMDMVLY